mgnify:CR=1 FL=1
MDGMLPESDQGSSFVVTVWTRGGQKYRFQGKYREMLTLPCMDPLRLFPYMRSTRVFIGLTREV